MVEVEQAQGLNGVDGENTEERALPYTRVLPSGILRRMVRLTYNGLHGVVSHNIEFFINTAV
jgi:hypothetical protein